VAAIVITRLTTCFGLLFLGILLGGGLTTHAQTPLQSVELAGQTLELWSVESATSFQADSSGEVYPNLRLVLDDFQKQKEAGLLSDETLKQMGMQYNRWEATEQLGRRNFAVLGMLLRDKSGKISADHLSFSVATRAVDSQGNVAARWPESGLKPVDCLISERPSYEWNDDRLVPLPVVVPEKANELTAIDAFAIITPASRHRFVFTVAELKSKARKSDDVITIVPLEYQATEGTQVAFEIFRPLPEMNANSRQPARGTKAKSSPVEQAIEYNIAARRSGEAISMFVKGKTAAGQLIIPIGSSSFSASRQYNAESSIKSELKLRSKGSRPPTTVAAASDRKKLVANLRVDLIAYRFKDPTLQQVVVELVMPTDLESVQQFQLRNVALQPANQRAGLQNYLASLEYAASQPKPKRSSTVRTWKDPSGKFAVEAELMLFDGQKAVLRKSDGKTIEVPISKLSEADQKFLNDL
jgi:hypothetical protein